jgi:hypothetical protein
MMALIVARNASLQKSLTPTDAGRAAEGVFLR